jgi:hypothetical protein
MTNPTTSWWHKNGWLLLAASPLGVYELVAVITGKVPTITSRWRDVERRNWWVHLLFLAGWCLLSSHLLANWP